jgi:hypothetical protein
LNIIRHRHEIDYVPWTDPLIVLTGLMFGYLLAAEIFSLVYRPARAGRKVAYLTLASFLFLVLTLAVLLSGQTQHGAHRELKDTIDRGEVSNSIAHGLLLTEETNPCVRPSGTGRVA